MNKIDKEMQEEEKLRADVATKCAVCGTLGRASEVYQERLKGEAFDAKAYSARRFEGKVGHFRIVRCQSCGLMRSDPIIDRERIEHLYTESHFTYEGLTENLKKTYGGYIKKAKKHLDTEVRPPAKKEFCPRTDLGGEGLLDVGCGNGFVLEEALKIGFKKVAGVEPSREAIAKANPKVRELIKEGIFTDQSFPPQSFDIVTLFQVMEHFADPLNVLQSTNKVLKRGGVVLALNHDMRAMPVRAMGERSPVIDLEHLYFFDQSNMRAIFEKAGFEILEQGRAWNYHSLGYLASLMGVKVKSDITVHLPIGNQYLIARKR